MRKTLAILASAWPPAHSPPAPRPARTVRTVIMDRAMAITATALVITGRPITAMSLTPTTVVPIIIGTTTGAITGNEKARNIVSGLFLLRVAGHLPRIRQTRWRAMSVEGASAPKKLALGPE